MPLPLSLVAWILACTASVKAIDAQEDGSAVARNPFDPTQTADLTSYVSRPDIRAPKWNITRHSTKKSSDGHWFVAPYGHFYTLWGRPEYSPCQVGPTIYDHDGELVWSGACLDQNRNVFDFRPFTVGGETRLSYIYAPQWGAEAGPDYPHLLGYAVLMDSNYNVYKEISPAEGTNGINPHELLVRDEGKRAFMIESRIEQFDDSEPTERLRNDHFVHDSIVELDTKSGEPIYRWSAHRHGIMPNETQLVNATESWNSTEMWDLLHINSVEPTASGDFITSARHSSTIYKIQRSTGNVLWRLGGELSSFSQDFNFTWQHDARVVFENETTTILSFFDNASQNVLTTPPSAVSSTAKLVALDTENMKATLLTEWRRPDGGLTQLRGSVQNLPDTGNILVSWSEQGYMSEHTQEGELLWEAKFSTPRFNTYRAYKAPFVGTPAEPPVMKSMMFKKGRLDTGTMISYVSWNGATEVKGWNLYGSTGNGKWTSLGHSKKTGFETMMVTSAGWSYVFMEAIDAKGKSLGRTIIQVVSKENGELSKDIVGDTLEDITTVQIGKGEVEDVVGNESDEDGEGLLNSFTVGSESGSRQSGVKIREPPPHTIGAIVIALVVLFMYFRRHARRKMAWHYLPVSKH
ncbi:ASST-domain-containing protein [Elsinoe ampelina]|uniref:ASST-domain-containing protein n=1 Tax=Elsinoe ampelina TaxID=302913 RepID=A0A6A6FYX8_9PEZI|nr:ASST-domain-containing protein [Elsinoe ampelina]